MTSKNSSKNKARNLEAEEAFKKHIIAALKSAEEAKKEFLRTGGKGMKTLDELLEELRNEDENEKSWVANKLKR